MDIGSGAAPADFGTALAAVAADPGVDALLVMHAPTAAAPPVEAAQAVAVAADQAGRKPVLACWMGGATAREGRALLRSRGIAGYDTPGPAVAAVGYLTDWGRRRRRCCASPTGATRKRPRRRRRTGARGSRRSWPRSRPRGGEC